MYVIDPLKSSDGRVRWLCGLMALGILILVGRLWQLQVLSFSKYEHFRGVQSSRSVREAPIRGKILDRNGRVLADNRPVFGVVLYLEELRPLFQATFEAASAGRSMGRAERNRLGERCRYTVVSNLCYQVGQIVGEPKRLDPAAFKRHYLQKLYVPMPVVENLTQEQVARFEERGSHLPGVKLNIESLREYPNGSIASHLLGYLRRADPKQSEDFDKFSYHQTDYRGVKGLERVYDELLRGKPGGTSVLINNLTFRQSEDVLFPAVPGDNLYLTIDLRIQKAAEEAFLAMGPETMGAAVVIDVTNGDILALASAPTYDPNEFITPLSQQRWLELRDHPQNVLLNRASFGIYTPGSIFKIVVGLACMEENNLDPEEIYHSLGYTRIGSRVIDDTAGPGEFNFSRALAKSSNPYFIHHGLDAGVDSLVKWGNRFFLGQKTGLLPDQEVSGSFPAPGSVRNWHKGEVANLCIGQGAITVTPVQMAVMMAAVANGGTVYQPRIAARVEPQSRESGRLARVYPPGEVRGYIGASPEVIRLIHEAMEREVSGPDGTGDAAIVPGLRIGGKTGTAETNKRINGRKIKDTWFVSFAPMEQPRYAVAVLVVDGLSGGVSCAPIAGKIYRVLRDLAPPKEIVPQARSLVSFWEP